MSYILPIIAGLAIGVAFIALFSLPIFPSQHDNGQALAEPALTVTLDRSAGESYTNNEQPLVSGYVSKAAADKVSIETYYPNGSLYREDQADVGRDGYYGHRIPMDAAIAVAGRYAVTVSYGNQAVETSFNHVVEYNHDPEQQSSLPPPSPPAAGFPRLDNVSSYISSPVIIS